jgi:hypothetical protein
MNTFKGHYTIHASEHPHLSETLAGEASARRRARLLVTFAELGCMLQKMGLTGMNKTISVSHPGSSAVHMDNTETSPASAALGDEFVTNLLATFMSPPPDATGDEPGEA